MDKIRRSVEGVATEALLLEIADLYHALRGAEDGTGATLAAGAGRWKILRLLARDGPQTVPRMARACGVSRQHVQALVNTLQRMQWVTKAENPQHRRSPVISITVDGREAYLQESEAVGRLADRAGAGLDRERLVAARSVLRELAARMRRD